jgi:hypothetical protein
MQCLGVRDTASRRIGEQPHWWASAIRLCLAPRLVRYLDRGLVAVEHTRAHDRSRRRRKASLR